MSGEAGKAVACAYMDAFNSGDLSAQADTFNFPHIRLAEGKFTVFSNSSAKFEYTLLGLSVSEM